MSLYIVIDGYNLIRQSVLLSRLDDQALELGREALIDFLAAYKRVKGHQISVVFDGINAPIFSQQRERLKGIDIRFSRSGEQADAVIKRMADRLKEKALVVTSDKEVADFAVEKGATAVSSLEFEEKMQMAVLMEMKGTDESGQNSGWKPTTQKKGPRKRLPRKARRKKKKLHKL
jgi:hypothetical protein